VNLEELRKIKAEQSEKYCKMTAEERVSHEEKIWEWVIEKFGSENFIQTSKQNIWKHVGRKTV
jgi:hypothetical protein